MTTDAKRAELLARLRNTWPADFELRSGLINPDGPEAAALIEILAALNEAPQPGPFSCYICGSIYPAPHGTLCSAAWPDDPKRYWPGETTSPNAAGEARTAPCPGSVERAEDMVHGMRWCMIAGRGCYHATGQRCAADETRGGEREAREAGQQLADHVIDDWFEMSKRDHFTLVGSEIRQLIGDLRRARAALAVPASVKGD